MSRRTLLLPLTEYAMLGNSEILQDPTAQDILLSVPNPPELPAGAPMGGILLYLPPHGTRIPYSLTSSCRRDDATPNLGPELQTNDTRGPMRAAGGCASDIEGCAAA